MGIAVLANNVDAATRLAETGETFDATTHLGQKWSDFVALRGSDEMKAALKDYFRPDYTSKTYTSTDYDNAAVTAELVLSMLNPTTTLANAIASESLDEVPSILKLGARPDNYLATLTLQGGDTYLEKARYAIDALGANPEEAFYILKKQGFDVEAERLQPLFDAVIPDGPIVYPGA